MAQENFMNGICYHCSKPIPIERLEALPDTQTCIDCSSTKPYNENDLDVACSPREDMIRAVSNCQNNN